MLAVRLPYVPILKNVFAQSTMDGGGASGIRTGVVEDGHDVRNSRVLRCAVLDISDPLNVSHSSGLQYLSAMDARGKICENLHPRGEKVYLDLRGTKPRTRKIPIERPWVHLVPQRACAVVAACVSCDLCMRTCPACAL